MIKGESGSEHTESRRSFLKRPFEFLVGDKNVEGLKKDLEEASQVSDRKNLKTGGLEFTRRDFMKAFVLTLGIEATSQGSGRGTDYLLETPLLHGVEKDLEQEPFSSAGYIEAQIGEPFFTTEWGHLRWLAESKELPVVKETTTELMRYMESIDEPAKFGDVIILAVEASRDFIANENPHLSQQELDKRAWQAGSITMARTFARIWSEAELGEFGQTNENDAFFSEGGMAWEKFPRLFGNKELTEDQKAAGRTPAYDRGNHAFSHMFLASEMIYSAKHGLKVDQEIPNGLKAWLDMKGGDIYQRASNFSDSVGKLYEYQSTWEDPRGHAINAEERKAGIFDYDHKKDLKGNQLGREVGLWVMRQLYEEGKTWDEIKSTIETLNDDKWGDPDTPVKFP